MQSIQELKQDFELQVEKRWNKTKKLEKKC